MTICAIHVYIAGYFMGTLDRPSEQLINAIRSTDASLSRQDAIRIAKTVVGLAAQEIAESGEVLFLGMNPQGQKRIVKIALQTSR